MSHIATRRRPRSVVRIPCPYIGASSFITDVDLGFPEGSCGLGQALSELQVSNIAR